MRFNVVVAYVVDDGTEVEEEKLSSILFFEFIGFRTVDVVKVEDEFFEDEFHVQLTV